MSERIARQFRWVAQIPRPALLPYVTAGDPALGDTLDLIERLAGAGADMIELGVPATDPFADGPMIQAAHRRALAARAGARQVLELIAAFRARHRDVPLVLTVYAPRLAELGAADFLAAAGRAGADAVVIIQPDFEIAPDLREACTAAGIAAIPVARIGEAPAETQRRISAAAAFIYCATVAGPTGMAIPDASDVAAGIAQLRILTALPLVAGFGIRTPELANAVGRVADGVIVGSALLRHVEGHPPSAAADAVVADVNEFASAIRRARF